MILRNGGLFIPVHAAPRAKYGTLEFPPTRKSRLISHLCLSCLRCTRCSRVPIVPLLQTILPTRTWPDRKIPYKEFLVYYKYLGLSVVRPNTYHVRGRSVLEIIKALARFVDWGTKIQWIPTDSSPCKPMSPAGSPHPRPAPDWTVDMFEGESPPTDDASSLQPCCISDAFYHAMKLCMLSICTGQSKFTADRFSSEVATAFCPFLQRALHRKLQIHCKQEFARVEKR